MKKLTFIARLSCALSFMALSVGCASSSTAAAVSDGPSNYPEFSWDKVPVCLHFSKSEGDFTDKEVDFIARFPLVCIEKTQGVRQYGGVEKGTLVAARAIKAKNPKSTVMFYMNSNIDYGGLYSTGPILTDDNHPEWAMKNVNGDYVLLKGGPTRIFDPSNPEMRRWWHDIIKTTLSDDAIGGVFIDALPKYAAAPENRKQQWGEEKYEKVMSGLHTMLDSLRADLTSMDKMMIANYLRGNTDMMADMGTHFLNHTDGAMMEHLAVLGTASKECIANDIELIAKAGREGKIIVVKGWPRYHLGGGASKEGVSQEQMEAHCKEDITFPLACFLTGAGKYAYFCYSWGYRETNGGMIDYDEYNRPLGAPLGDAVREGWVYTRSFEHADIWLDIENRKAEINWK